MAVRSKSDVAKCNVGKIQHCGTKRCPDNKVHGANMGSIWGRQDPGGPHVGPMNFALQTINMQAKRESLIY